MYFEKRLGNILTLATAGVFTLAGVAGLIALPTAVINSFAQDEPVSCTAILVCSEEIWRGTCSNGQHVVVMQSEGKQVLMSSFPISTPNALAESIDSCEELAQLDLDF